MISLSGYFDYKEDIKTILVIAEHDNTCDLLLKLCTIKHDLKKLYLAGNSKKRLAKMVSVLKRTAEQNSSFHLPQITLVPYLKTIEYSFDTPVDAVIFDSNAKRAAILSTKSLKPA